MKFGVQYTDAIRKVQRSTFVQSYTVIGCVPVSVADNNITVFVGDAERAI